MGPFGNNTEINTPKCKTPFTKTHVDNTIGTQGIFFPPWQFISVATRSSMDLASNFFLPARKIRERVRTVNKAVGDKPTYKQDGELYQWAKTPTKPVFKAHSICDVQIARDRAAGHVVKMIPFWCLSSSHWSSCEPFWLMLICCRISAFWGCCAIILLFQFSRSKSVGNSRDLFICRQSRYLQANCGEQLVWIYI